MEISYLVYFRTVAQTEHISRAAEQLHMTQPALSRAIARMEAEVGAPLFVREANRIHLNHAGRVFLFRVEQMLAEYDDAMREIKDASTADAGSVMILSPSDEVVAGFLYEYLLKYPKIQLFHRTATPSDTVHLLETHGADFAITPPIASSPKLLWKPLIQERYLLAVSKDSRYAAEDSVDLTELSNEYFIFSAGGTVFDDQQREFCHQAGFDPKVRIKVSECDLTYELLCRNQGVMFLPAGALYQKHHMRLNTCKNSLRFLDIRYPICQRTLGVASLKGGYLSNAARTAWETALQYYTGLGNMHGIEIMK